MAAGSGKRVKGTRAVTDRLLSAILRPLSLQAQRARSGGRPGVLGAAFGRLSRMYPLRLLQSKGGLPQLQTTSDKLRQKSNRAVAVDVDRFKETAGIGQD